MVERRTAAGGEVSEGDASERHLRSLVEALRASEARLAEAERLAGLGSWTWEAEGNTLSYSAEMYEILGRDFREGPIGFDEAAEWTHPEDRVMVAAAIERMLSSHEPFDLEYRIVRPDGEVRWMQGRAEVTERDGAKIKRLTGFGQDITARREAEDRRREAREHLAHHHEVLRRIARGEPMAVTLDGLCREIEHRFEGARCSVLLVDADERVLRHAAAPTLPYEVVQALDGLPVAVGMGACGTAAARKEAVVVEDTFSDPLTAPFLQLAADYQLGAVWSQPLLNPTGDVLGTFALYRERPHAPDQEERDTVAAAASVAAIAIERALAEEALTEAAHVDALTRLPNRNHFLERLDEELSVPDAHLAVMFLDLDRFKWINDSLGHPTGDRILVEVAARLRRVLRDGDIVARFGGDEFTILVNDADLPAVEGIASRLESAFTEPFLLDGGEFFLSVSVGIAVADRHSDAYGLIRDADAAMYSAKEGGRARHAMFDDGLRRRALARVTLETELRRGIEREEFALNFQPIRDLRSGDWVALEALVRWHHPTRGLLGPDEFIPLAEETGLIVPLGQRLIDRAVRQVAVLLQAGTPIRVAVNLSVVQLSDPGMPDELQQSLRSHDVPAELIVVEITETGLMQRLDAARGALEQIANLGVSVVIDDFGTGYSSIARLGELPVVAIKVDRRFTHNLGVDPDVGLVLGAITDLAHALDLRVIAEGVETAAGLATASELGCDYAQGYYLARPAPASEIGSLLQ